VCTGLCPGAFDTALGAAPRVCPPILIGVWLQTARQICRRGVGHHCPRTPCALPAAENVVSRYLAKHPALTELMHDFLTNVLVNKPDDCYQFCQVRVWVSVCAFAPAVLLDADSRGLRAQRRTGGSAQPHVVEESDAFTARSILRVLWAAMARVTCRRAGATISAAHC
jgi:hypothetical protein